MRRVLPLSSVSTFKLSLFATRFTAISLLLRFELLQVGLEAIETLFPDRAVALGPRGHFLERSRLEPAGPPLGLASTHDQARPFEHPQMLRDRGQTDLERSGQLGDRALPRDESRENRAAGGIRQGRERPAQLVWLRLVAGRSVRRSVSRREPSAPLGLVPHPRAVLPVQLRR